MNEEWVLHLPQQKLNNLILPPTIVRKKASSLARKFAAQHASVLGVEENNEVEGVTPTTEVTMKIIETELVGGHRLAVYMTYESRFFLYLRVKGHMLSASRQQAIW